MVRLPGKNPVKTKNFPLPQLQLLITQKLQSCLRTTGEPFRKERTLRTANLFCYLIKIIFRVMEKFLPSRR